MSLFDAILNQSLIETNRILNSAQDKRSSLSQQDSNGNTVFHLATTGMLMCILQHIDKTLAKELLSIRNDFQQLPIDVAKCNDFTKWEFLSLLK